MRFPGLRFLGQDGPGPPTPPDRVEPFRPIEAEERRLRSAPRQRGHHRPEVRYFGSKLCQILKVISIFIMCLNYLAVLVVSNSSPLFAPKLV